MILILAMLSQATYSIPHCRKAPYSRLDYCSKIFIRQNKSIHLRWVLLFIVIRIKIRALVYKKHAQTKHFCPKYSGIDRITKIDYNVPSLLNITTPCQFLVRAHTFQAPDKFWAVPQQLLLAPFFYRAPVNR